MYARDRLTNLGLFGAAMLAWVVVVVLVTTRSPVGDVGLQVFGALLLGIASALTITPLFWLAAFSRHGGIAYRGDWSKALRRGAEVGLVVTVLVVLRSQGAFSWPLALFIVVMAAFVEIGLSAQR
jgi:hypothetical protein